MAKKVAMVVVSVAVIAACAWFMWPRGRGVPRERLMRPFVCEACGHHFKAVPGTGPVPCPQCQKTDTALCHEYVCRKCGARFEAFRERQAREGGGAPSPDEPPVMEYKRPGGDWVRSAEQLGKFTCPKCQSSDVGPPKPGQAAP